MKRFLVALLVIVPLSGAAGREQKKFYIQGITLSTGAVWSRYSELPRVATIPEIRGVLGNNTGAVAGVALEAHLSDHIMIDSGLQYVRKGTAVNWYYFDEPGGKWVYNLDMLSFPVTYRFKPLSRSSPYILAGYELSIIDHHHQTDFTGALGPVKTDLAEQTKDIDLGFIAGVGAELVFKKWTPFVEFRYHIGLLNISKGTGPLESYPTIRTRALVLLAGIRFRLKRDAL